MLSDTGKSTFLRDPFAHHPTSTPQTADKLWGMIATEKNGFSDFLVIHRHSQVVKNNHIGKTALTFYLCF